MAEMGLDTFKANLTSPARGYIWEVMIPVPIGGGDSTAVTLRARSTQIPGRSFETIDIPYKQTAGIVVNGRMKYDHTWNCTFLENEDGKIFKMIRAWQQLIIDDRTGIGLGENGTRTVAYLKCLKQDGSSWLNIKLKDVWISDQKPVELAQDQGTSLITFNVTFVYNSWEPA